MGDSQHPHLNNSYNNNYIVVKFAVWKININFVHNLMDIIWIKMSNNQQIVMNRIKVTLVEKQKTNRWLAEQMGKSENTISRWCSNKSQPSIAQLQEIASLLDVDVRELLKSQKE